MTGGGLLERSAQLERIEAALTGARAGHGAFVVLEGPAGIGKTALLTAARAAAADGGMRVLRARGTELERDFPFGVVRQLFETPLVDATVPERGDLLDPAAGAAAAILGFPGVRPDDGPPWSGVDPSFAVLHGLYWLCANLAATRPLCVVVDDAHLADAASLRYLAFLLTRLEELSAALILATRPQEGTDAELLLTLTTDASANVILVPPLTRTAVAKLVESRLGGASDLAFIDACLHATRGTPFLMRVLVEALREGGVTPTASAARDVQRIGARSVGRSIRLRLRRLPEHAGRLARALSVLEQDDFFLAAQLAGLEGIEAAEAVDLLTTGGLLEPGRPLKFVHPIVRSGIYSELTAAERARGHRSAARLLAEQPDADAHVAEHLLVTEPAGDPWVVERLAAAACAAGKQGAPECEAVFLRRVLAEPPPVEERSALLLDLGMAEASAGQPDWPEHLRRAVDTAPTVAAAAEAALVLAHALSGAQRFGEAAVVLDGAAATLDAPDTELALRVEAAAVVAEMNDPVKMATVSARRERLLQRAAEDRAAPAELLAAAAFISVLSNEPAEVGTELAGRALRAGDVALHGPDGRPWFSFTGWFSQAAFSLLWTERYGPLRPLLDASIAHGRATGDATRLAMGLANRGWLALREGDLRAAECDTRMALAATELPAPPMYRAMSGALLVETLVEQGDLDAAENALAPLDCETESGSLIAAMLRFARGRLRVARGQVTAGLDDLLAVGEILTRAQITCPGAMPWRSEAALVQRTLGDDESARRLAEEELELARAFGAPRAVGVALRAAGVVAGGDRGALMLREAIDVFERADARQEQARALADLGALLRRRNRRSEARELLRVALDSAHHSGAKLLAAQAEVELRATGARPRRSVLTGLDSLTASERRIAELARRGLTNREIAQTLFITTRTVEGHLTSVFRKLRVDSRDQLPAVLTGVLVPA